MTPEELDRSMDFIIQSQARLAVAQEQDREWSKRLFVRMADDRVRMIGIIDHHSRQLDQFGEFMRETRAWQQEFQREALARLDRILDKLSPGPECS